MEPVTEPSAGDGQVGAVRAASGLDNTLAAPGFGGQVDGRRDDRPGDGIAATGLDDRLGGRVDGQRDGRLGDRVDCRFGGKVGDRLDGRFASRFDDRFGDRLFDDTLDDSFGDRLDNGIGDRFEDVCIVTLARSLRVLEANGDFIRRLGRAAARIYGMSFVDLVHPEFRAAILRQLVELGQGRCDRFSSRFTGVGADGSIFPADITGIAVRGDHGRVSTIVLLVRPHPVASADAAAAPHAVPPHAAPQHATPTRATQPRATQPRAATAKHDATAPPAAVPSHAAPSRGATPPSGGKRRKPLSELDARVLEGIAAGISTVQLASKLYLSRQGVEYHVGAMLRRFKSPNRSALVAKAYSQGILMTGEWPPRVTQEFIR